MTLAAQSFPSKPPGEAVKNEDIAKLVANAGLLATMFTDASTEHLIITQAAEAITTLQAKIAGLEGENETLRGFVRIAVDQAKRMKNSARLMGPREVHDDPRLAKLWVRWTYDQGKQLLDALKPARASPTPQGGKL